ncbi:hypothetical protein Hhal_0020 [Halorhodospira halophila SL1]|uniref:LytR/CpsA/Psr regulator C-terminal domain-containing protein n=1 Tax=Halorhodospira halophila (strain DSM 244 / SL1) TaxID=349124 RepID=A1WT03_HALHL|nr:hypothetical protein Hhal_0020 [Halorhodospira halophila SL1]
MKASAIAGCCNKLRHRIVAGAALVTAGNAVAGSTLPESGILDPGQIDVRGTVGLSYFGAGQGTTMDVLPSLRTGLPGPFDVAVTVPYRNDLEQEQYALRSSFRTDFSYRFLDDGPRQAVLGGYMTFDPSDAGEGVGSGSHNYGVSADYRAEDIVGTGTFYLRGAVERLDHRDDPGADEVSYRLANRLTAEIGLGLDVDVDAEPYFGLRGTQGLGSTTRDQQSLSFRPGIRFRYTPNSEVQFLAQFDTVQRNAEPERAIFVTWTYQHRPPERDLDSLRERISANEMAIERLDRRVSDIERRLLTRTEVPEPETREGVVVLNHSGIPELTTLVVDTLENLDLSVGDTRDEDDVARRDRTKILYRPGHAERAREIARALPGNQLIEQRDDMPNQAEIAVLIGFDLE